MNINGNKPAYILYIEDEAKKTTVLDHDKMREKWNRNIHIRNLWYVREKELSEVK